MDCCISSSSHRQRVLHGICLSRAVGRQAGGTQESQLSGCSGGQCGGLTQGRQEGYLLQRLAGAQGTSLGTAEVSHAAQTGQCRELAREQQEGYLLQRLAGAQGAVGAGRRRGHRRGRRRQRGREAAPDGQAHELGDGGRAFCGHEEEHVEARRRDCGVRRRERARAGGRGDLHADAGLCIRAARTDARHASAALPARTACGTLCAICIGIGAFRRGPCTLSQWALASLQASELSSAVALS